MRESNGITVHRDGYGGHFRPAVNVKVYGAVITPGDVQERFGYDKAKAIRACEWAWESACEDFWEYSAKPFARDYFGDKAEVYQEGRSGGWLVVDGLPEVGEWDWEMRAKWAEFERHICACVNVACDPTALLDTIEANGWADPEEQDPNEVTARYQGSLAGMRG